MALENNLFKAQTENLAQLQNYIKYIEKWNSQSKQVYFINIRSFSWIFFWKRFYSIIRNLLQGAAIKILYF